MFAIYLSFMFQFKFKPPKYNYEPVVQILPFIILSYLVYMHVFQLSDFLKLTLSETVYSVFLTVIALFITTAFIAFFARGFAYPRVALILGSIIQITLLTIWRLAVWKIRRKRHGIKTTLVIGGDMAENVAKKILLKQKDLYNVKYICSSDSCKLFQYIDKVDVVFICTDVEPDVKNHVVDTCLIERKSIYIVPNIYEIALLNSKLNRVDDVPMLKVRQLGLTTEQKILKRVVDIVFALLGIVIALPFMLISAIIIKLTDGGNIFYGQERLTIDEKKFKVLKFRTMIMNAEKHTGPVLAGECDLRITKIGRFMRSTRIDELPQLFNILKGDMSIVGPRPERPFFVQQFKEGIPNYKYRTLVKSGLTGLAQVLGKYSTTAEDKVIYDLMYIENYSILLDMKLILQTIKIVFMKESSQGVREDVSLNNLIGKFKLEITIDEEKDENV